MSLLLTLAQLTAQTAIQAPEAVTTNSAQVSSTLPAMSLFELACKGGWIMIILGILSLIAFYILFERIYTLKKESKEAPHFMDRIRDYMLNGDTKAALHYCKSVDTATARMVQKGIMRLGRPLTDIQSAIENVGNLEVAQLEKGLPVMATIAAGAPMLGFLGTVTGMVSAFYQMANAGSNVDISMLSGGIYEALVTTVGGLIVGIIALFSYNYLVGLVNGLVNKMEANILAFMDLLNEPIQK